MEAFVTETEGFPSSGVPFDDDAVGYSVQEQKEVAGRDIPPGWHALVVHDVKKLTDEADVRWEALKPYLSALYAVTFKITIEGRSFPVTHTEQILGKKVQLTSKKGTQYYPTACRLGSDLQRATKIEGPFRGALDAAMTMPLFGRFKDSDAGFTNMEAISDHMPKSRN